MFTDVKRWPAAVAVTRLELVLALAVLGLVALWAAPRLSPGSPSVNPEALARTRLRILRVAIERYYQDHGAFPGAVGTTGAPSGSEAAVVSQLTQYSTPDGRVSATRDAQHHLGPYLAQGIPPCPLGDAGAARRVYLLRAGAIPEEATGGWIYDCVTGDIRPAAAP